MDTRRDENGADVPCIVIRYAGCEKITEVSHVEYGIEEEGVPWTVQQGYGGDGITVARGAAADSSLRIGVSVTPDSRIVVHHKRLPDDEPVFDIADVTAETARKLGANSARLAKGTPFKTVE